ncbi:hypothetical protein L596_001311 [Steinernema carpocapsae]|uniref:Uncharacterized protein n=1 Tax=Steinernema carpocapsae TaxID=34508 RepID=A0A4U8UPX9_STECR|nr:hypothetical protein L596_001311 [Steinernema carpocapsae]
MSSDFIVFTGSESKSVRFSAEAIDLRDREREDLQLPSSKPRIPPPEWKIARIQISKLRTALVKNLPRYALNLIFFTLANIATVFGLYLPLFIIVASRTSSSTYRSWLPQPTRPVRRPVNFVVDFIRLSNTCALQFGVENERSRL